MSSTPWGRNIPTACAEARSAGQPRCEEFSRANATKAREGPTMLQSRLRTAWWKVVITCQTPAKNCPALAPRATARHSTQTSVGSKASSTLLSADTPCSSARNTSRDEHITGPDTRGLHDTTVQEVPQPLPAPARCGGAGMEHVFFGYRIHHRRRPPAVGAQPSGVVVESRGAGHTQTGAFLDCRRIGASSSWLRV